MKNDNNIDGLRGYQEGILRRIRKILGTRDGMQINDVE